MLGHHRPASETSFKWRFASGPMIARLKWYLDPPIPHQLRKKKHIKVGPPPPDNTSWIRACKVSVTADFFIITICLQDNLSSANIFQINFFENFFQKNHQRKKETRK